MTCIVGLVEKDKLWIGADSIGTRGNESTVLASPKVFQNGSFLFGCAGSPRHAQILRTSLFNPPKQKDKQSDLEYLIIDVVGHIRSIFAEQGALEQVLVKTDQHASEYLIGYGSRIWMLENNFQLIDSVEPFGAVGCGSQYAKAVLGALEHNDFGKGFSAKKKLEIALVEAERNDPFVRGPFHFLKMKITKSAEK